MQTTERNLHLPDNFDLWIFSVWIRSRVYKERLLEKRVVKIIVIYECNIVT